MKNKLEVLVVDYGSQTTQLILRRIREMGVYCELSSFKNIYNDIRKIKPNAVILSGGPASAFEKKAPKLDKRILGMGIPILGVCYGMQLICQSFDSEIRESRKKEFGKAYIKILKKNILFSGLNIKNKHQVWMSHGDEVAKISPKFEVIAKSNDKNITAIVLKGEKIFGLQFHPEVVHTIIGEKIIENFLFKVAKIRPDWKIENFLEDKIKDIGKTIGNNKVVCGLSGGVDSSVTAALLSKAIGNNLICIFVDHGLLRKGESEEVVRNFRNYAKAKLIHIRAKKIFLAKLKGIKNPEQKRKIIGKEFIRIFEKEAKKIKNVKFLAQGTLYPDIIESRSTSGSKTSKIKSHHNVGGLPKKMNLKLIEPLKEFFKDEVRILGKSLGLSKDISNRHPFPGPGLAIRIVGNITREKIRILQEADHIYINELNKSRLYDKIWQAYAALLPIKTVGVMGDSRTYEYTCLLRAVTSEDGMTADYFNFPKYFLDEISNKIVNNVKGINRVVYDISSKPPSTIELE